MPSALTPAAGNATSLKLLLQQAIEEGKKVVLMVTTYLLSRSRDASAGSECNAITGRGGGRSCRQPEPSASAHRLLIGRRVLFLLSLISPPSHFFSSVFNSPFDSTACFCFLPIIPHRTDALAAAQHIGLAAVKYFELSQNPTTDYIFSFPKVPLTSFGVCVCL